MAKFEADGGIEIYITPQEFMKNCSATELIRLRELAKDEFDLVSSDYIPEEEDFGPPPRSYSQIKFNKALITLEESWHYLTKADEEIIEKIAEKYE